MTTAPEVTTRAAEERKPLARLLEYNVSDASVAYANVMMARLYTHTQRRCHHAHQYLHQIYIRILNVTVYKLLKKG